MPQPATASSARPAAKPFRELSRIPVRDAATAADFRALLATAEAREWVLVIMLAGTMIGIASVVSGALTTKSLRPLSRISVGFMFGISSVVFYLAFLVFLQNLPGWVKGWEMAAVYLDTALWQASLAANVRSRTATGEGRRRRA